jgi:hypothetical protein
MMGIDRAVAIPDPMALTGFRNVPDVERTVEGAPICLGKPGFGE